MGELRFVLDIPELGGILSRIEELQQDVNTLSTKIDNAKTRITTDLDALRQQIAQAQVDETALAQINETVDGLQATVDSIDPSPAPDAGGTDVVPADPPTADPLTD